MAVDLAALARSITSVEVLFRGQRITLRVVSGAEHGRIVAALGDQPAPPWKRPPGTGSRAALVPDDGDPAYRRELAAWRTRYTAAQVAVSMEVSVACTEGQTPCTMAEAAQAGQATAWCAAAARMVLEHCSIDEVMILDDARAAIGSSRATVGVRGLIEDALELAAACESEQKPALAALATDLARSIGRIGLPSERPTPDADRYQAALKN